MDDLDAYDQRLDQIAEIVVEAGRDHSSMTTMEDEAFGTELYELLEDQFSEDAAPQVRELLSRVMSRLDAESQA